MNGNLKATIRNSLSRIPKARLTFAVLPAIPQQDYVPPYRVHYMFGSIQISLGRHPAGRSLRQKTIRSDDHKVHLSDWQRFSQ